MGIIAVDVDDCVVDIYPYWLKYCNWKYGKNLSMEEVGYDHNLRNIFGQDCIDFWSLPNLYSHMIPIDGSVEILHSLYTQGWTIGFCSYAKKGHFESKCEWIKKYFPFYSFINATKEKGYTRCDVFIDDNNKYLNQQPQDVKLIRKYTPYTQEEELTREHKVMYNWYELHKLLEE